MPTHLLEDLVEDQLCLQVCWVTCGCGSVQGHGFDWSCNEVKANNVDAQNPTNTRVVKALVTGSLRVRQLWWRQWWKDWSAQDSNSNTWMMRSALLSNGGCLQLWGDSDTWRDNTQQSTLQIVESKQRVSAW